MSKRLQVVMADDELARYEQVARAMGLTLSTWVRQSLRKAQQDVAEGNVDAKLAAIREAYAYAFPAPDVEEMLAEVERGYLADAS
jgi:hypothetical protein